MSLSNPDCYHITCEFCDSEEDMFGYYIVPTLKENEGRIPGLIDESN